MFALDENGYWMDEVRNITLLGCPMYHRTTYKLFSLFSVCIPINMGGGGRAI